VSAMDAEDCDRIEASHRPCVTWQNATVGWVCLCGNSWPCRLLQLADDARRAHAAITRAYVERAPNEFWVSDRDAGR
jgi:hypothetical protein